MTTQWHSEQAQIQVGTALASVATNTYITASFSGTDYTSEVKDINITGGERDIETVKLLGYNETVNKKRATPITATFTVVSTDRDWLEFWLGSGGQLGGTGAGWYRMQGGEKTGTVDPYSQRTTKAILFTVTDGTNTVNVLLNNAYFTTIEHSLAADSTMELKVTAKCLASDFYIEDDFA